MANNLIQIKRTSVSGRAANTSTLSNPGELALNMADGILYSGNGSYVFEIGANNTNVNVSNVLTVSGVTTVNSTGITTTGTLTANGDVSGNELTSTFASGDEGGQINLAKPPNATTNGGIVIDAYQNKLRIYENGGGFRGAYIDLTAAANGVGSNLLGGGGGTGTVTSVGSGDGLTGGPITASGTLSVLANTGIIANASGIFVNSSYIATLTANNANNLGGAAAANYVQNTDSRTLSGNLAFTGANLSVSGNLTIESAGELIIASGAGIVANGTLGTANQVLTTDGTTVYWANAAAGGGGGFTNGQSISVNNFVITGAFSANTSNGIAGQVLTTSNTGVYWSNVSILSVYYANGTLAFNGSGVAGGGVAAAALGNGGDEIFYENDLTITADYTIGSNKNAMTAGPISINSNVVVTIPSGSVWTIV